MSHPNPLTHDQHKMLSNLLLYIFQQTASKPLGLTSLHKLLYFIDFDYFEIHEEHLLGLTYHKKQYGPMLECLTSVLKGMEHNYQIESSERQIIDFPQIEHRNLTAPNVSVFSHQQLEHIDWEIQRFANKTAKDISDFSHSDTPWRVAEHGEELNYQGVFYRDSEHSVGEQEDV